MNSWTLVQVCFDLFSALALFMVLMRISRQPKDDPRMSRGLQLLQSKIAVLEDLSDRTETQVSQLTAILDQKSKEVQAKVQLAEQHVHEIRVSMERSLEVAKIFQDKIPHQEIIERQNTIKYVQAARFAHQGLSADEIANKVDLPKGEIEFIAKVNREQLMFSEDGLPWWAKGEAQAANSNLVGSTGGSVDGQLGHLAFSEGEARHKSGYGAASNLAPQPSSTPSNTSFEIDPMAEQTARLKAEIEIAERQRLVENLSRLQFEMQTLDQQLVRESSGRDLSDAFAAPKFETTSLSRIGEEFRKACDDATASASRLPPLEQLSALIPQIFQSEGEPHTESRIREPVKTEKASTGQVDRPAPAAIDPDPAAVRAAAVAKVQQAMNRARAPKASGSSPSADLARARSLAKDANVTGAGQMIGQAPATAKAAPGEVRRVQFPRIDLPK